MSENARLSLMSGTLIFISFSALVWLIVWATRPQRRCRRTRAYRHGRRVLLRRLLLLPARCGHEWH
jgi:hypothetical protein